MKTIEYIFLKENTLKETITKKNKKQVSCVRKINKSNLIKGIFNSFLYDMLHDRITQTKIDIFKKSYIVIITNEKDRSFPRTAKTPFTKWYIKGYSEMTKYAKIVDAIINEKVDNLNKNLKMIAKTIIAINGKKFT